MIPAAAAFEGTTPVDRYPADALAAWTAAVFGACGVPRADADTAAQVLVRTSLRGIDTHGISRVPAYVERLRAGEVNAAARPHAVWRDGALQVDGGGALGQVVASQAVDEAIVRSERIAAVACTLRDSGHLSALGLFTLRAAEHGRVALLCQKTPPIMALPGALRAAIGNNPIAFAVPVAGGPPLVFDMAASTVARGHVLQALRDGVPIPADWALGPDGAPTTDPKRALEGAMLPVAAHKGIGLAMMVECLAGALAEAVGSAPDDAAPSPPAGGTVGSAGGVSAFLLVLNPDLFVGRDAFDHAMARWLRGYLDAAGPDARYPGQRQAACEAERRANGIPVADSVLRELRRTGEAIGQAFALQPVG